MAGVHAQCERGTVGEEEEEEEGGGERERDIWHSIVNLPQTLCAASVDQSLLLWPKPSPLGRLTNGGTATMYECNG